MKKSKWEGLWLMKVREHLLTTYNCHKRWEDLVWKLTFEQWKSIFDSLAPGFRLVRMWLWGCKCFEIYGNQWLQTYSNRLYRLGHQSLQRTVFVD